MATKPGKWAYLRGKYPQLPLDPKREDVLRTLRDRLTTDTVNEETNEVTPAELPADPSLADILDRYERCYAECDRLQTLLAEEEALFEVLETMIRERMEADKLDQARVNGYLYTPGTEPHPNTTDRSKLIAWVRASNMEDILTVHHGTLSGIIKDRLERNVELPDGVDLFWKPKLSRTKQRS